MNKRGGVQLVHFRIITISKLIIIAIKDLMEMLLEYFLFNIKHFDVTCVSIYAPLGRMINHDDINFMSTYLFIILSLSQ